MPQENRYEVMLTRRLIRALHIFRDEAPFRRAAELYRREKR
jgi:hypothetical protein